MSSRKKQVKELRAEFEERGWETSLTSGGHVRFTHTDGGLVFAPSSPSDHRSIENARHELLRQERAMQTGDLIELTEQMRRSEEKAGFAGVSCRLCGRMFVSYVGMSRHLKADHPEPELEPAEPELAEPELEPEPEPGPEPETPDEERPMHRSTQPIVLAFMKQHPDEPVSIDEVATATDLTKTQISNALSAMVRHPDLGVSRIGRGVYRYAELEMDREKEPEQEHAAELDGWVFERIGQARDGSVVLKDDAGSLWKAVPL